MTPNATLINELDMFVSALQRCVLHDRLWNQIASFPHKTNTDISSVRADMSDKFNACCTYLACQSALRVERCVRQRFLSLIQDTSQKNAPRADIRCGNLLQALLWFRNGSSASEWRVVSLSDRLWSCRLESECNVAGEKQTERSACGREERQETKTDQMAININGSIWKRQQILASSCNVEREVPGRERKAPEFSIGGCAG